MDQDSNIPSVAITEPVEPSNKDLATSRLEARREARRAQQEGKFRRTPLGYPPSGGVPQGRTFRKGALKQLRMEVCPGIHRLDLVADAIVTKAEQGDMRAAEFLRDTVDGPLEQQFANVALGFSVTVNHGEATEE